MDSDLEYCRESFKSADYGHYVISLLMPRDKQAALWTIGAFKNVLESIPSTVTETTLGFMRLTWWRDQIEKLETGEGAKGQPVLAALRKYAQLKNLADLINEHEALLEHPDKAFLSAVYPEILEFILGADYPRYRRLSDKLVHIFKKYKGTKWEASPPFLALRLWFSP